MSDTVIATSTYVEPFNGSGDAGRRDGFVYLDNSPREWRADCKAGAFKIGEDDIKGRTIAMKIIGIKGLFCEILSYPAQMWVELAFIDEEDCISSLLVKGISVRELKEFMRRITIDEVNIMEKIVTATMNKKSGDKGDYYYMTFSMEDNTDEQEIERVKSFANNNLLHSRLSELIQYSNGNSGNASNGNDK